MIRRTFLQYKAALNSKCSAKTLLSIDISSWECFVKHGLWILLLVMWGSIVSLQVGGIFGLLLPHGLYMQAAFDVNCHRFIYIYMCVYEEWVIFYKLFTQQIHGWNNSYTDHKFFCHLFIIIPQWLDLQPVTNRPENDLMCHYKNLCKLTQRLICH